MRSIVVKYKWEVERYIGVNNTFMGTGKDCYTQDGVLLVTVNEFVGKLLYTPKKHSSKR
jgi:hypothetical protein